ncbi:hypothetical protein ABT381_03705 [Streptomyces sp. NPDC000151]|uniref:hypothetical protein n=1 Tax=Streptomyces sp. NPDC000151 TaxID=3154244 RepID=UPI00331D93A4
MDDKIIAALIAAAVSTFGIWLSYRMNRVRLRSELVSQRERLEREMQAHENRLRMELRTEFMAEEAIQNLLCHPKWKKRSFQQIKARIGGFDDNHLRQLLVRSGAVRFGEPGEREGWGLRELHTNQL